jgi:hypothetical protein
MKMAQSKNKIKTGKGTGNSHALGRILKKIRTEELWNERD